MQFLHGPEKELKLQLTMGQYIRTWRFKSHGVLEIAPAWDLADVNSSLTSDPSQLGALGQDFSAL